ALGRSASMAREQQPETDIGARHTGLERLRESIEHLLMTSEVQYGVRFDDHCTDSQFAYSWAAIWSEN
uniref:hypothetical protein n=1 Tax=Salmonella sp. SAL04286 TaxID=3159864 RepID=UPI00397DB66A